ncbi:MAG: slipin family protein [Oligoflexales bacterium]|nr:slipin family protein [Oligoflexales bacterium]
MGLDFGFIIVVMIVVVLISMSIRIISEYDRAIIFRFGRALSAPKGPGIIFMIPIVDKIEAKVSIRTITMDITPQDIITRDNISLKVNAVLYFKVVDPMKAILNVENYLYATSQLSQTHLRSILGEHMLDQILTERDNINERLQTILDQNTDPWGIKVVAVEIKHVDLPAEQQRAMSKQAEAEREKRAKIISAEGELQSATKLKEASDIMSTNPITLQLRYLQTISDMATEQNTRFIIFPVPFDLLKGFKNLGDFSKET